MLNNRPTSISLSKEIRKMAISPGKQDNYVDCVVFCVIHQQVCSLLWCRAFTESHANIKEIHRQKINKYTHLSTHAPPAQYPFLPQLNWVNPPTLLLGEGRRWDSKHRKGLPNGNAKGRKEGWMMDGWMGCAERNINDTSMTAHDENLEGREKKRRREGCCGEDSGFIREID